jgi:hypothetical protein
MKTALRLTALAALALTASAVAGPSIAVAADAQLYELTENMRLVDERVVHRTATSELMGFAVRGTPLCPDELLQGLVAANVITVIPETCSINATGSDDISTATGKGTFGGRYTVVVQGDNPVDGPELVVGKGKFSGKMDFSPAILHGVPLGSVVGNLKVDGAEDGIPFTGTFRLPFVLPVCSDGTPAATGSCTAPATLTDLVTPPLYLGDNFVPFQVAQPGEFSLGEPTVRFEISFDKSGRGLTTP